MAIGDDALNAGMDVLTGNEPANTLDTEINKSRDYIAQRTSAVTPISKGGTGADNAAAARENLGVVLTTTSGSSPGGKVPVYTAGGQLATSTPSSSGHAANKSYVDTAIGNIPAPNLSAYMPRSGGTFTSAVQVNGNFHLPNSSAASTGYTVAYINGDGRVSRGASSERYKKYISEIDPETLGDIWPELVRYQMRGGDGSWKYGYIAERLDESDDLRPFVIYQTETTYDEETDEYTTVLATDEDGNLVPESIDFIALLMAQNAQLRGEVTTLRQTVYAILARLEATE